jgi:DNA-binding NarL/FixJ family response regulator
MSLPARPRLAAPAPTAEDPPRPPTPTIAADTAAEIILGSAWPVSPGDDSAARMYLALVRHPQPSRKVLRGEGFTPTQIERGLALLESRGLVSVDGSDSIDVPSPDMTLPTYAASLEQQAVTSRSAVQGLTQLYRLARAESPGTLSAAGIGLLGSPLEIEQARWEVISLARSTLLRVFALGPGTEGTVLGLANELAEAAGPSGPLARVPDRRAVFDATILETDGALDTLGRLAEAGVEVRIAARVPCSAVVSDRAVVVDLSHLDPTGFGSMFIRHRPLVQVVRLIAEGVHDSGSSLSRALAAEAPHHWLDARDRQILLLIAAGATDTMIARQVRISQRTVERRLRAIMDELGATTRFQAGVQAAKRGLI